MTITEDFQDIVEQYKQEAAALEVRKMLRNLYDQASNTNKNIQRVVDSGKFSLIPESVKNALNNFWTLAKDFQEAVETDPDIMEIKDVELTET